MYKVSVCRRILSFIMVLALVFTSVLPGYAQNVFVSTLPEPGVMVVPTPAFVPVLVKGLVIHPEEPLRVDFIVDSGNDSAGQAVIKEQSMRMAKYFLAAVTIPEKQLWVNLSPYEKDRIIENALGATDLGRDMLAQDYVLKQLAASLIYPENGLGKDFWTRVYQEALDKFGTTDIPVDAFNKVWIMPGKAEVFERGDTVYVTGAELKVMLDADHAAMQEQGGPFYAGDNDEAVKDILRQVIVPAIEKEVNEGKNFAEIRQIYHAAILAKWYRTQIKETLLAEVYVGQGRVAGVISDERGLQEEIYQRYMAAYKKGVFDYIKEEGGADVVPKKYFSGGESFENIELFRIDRAEAVRPAVGSVFKVAVMLENAFLGSAVAHQNVVSSMDDDARRALNNKTNNLIDKMLGQRIKEKFLSPAQELGDADVRDIDEGMDQDNSEGSVVHSTQVIMDWLAQRDTLPQEADLVWLFGTKNTRQVYEAASFLKDHPWPVLITGGIGKGANAVTLQEAVRDQGLRPEALSVLQDLLDNMPKEEIFTLFHIDPQNPKVSLENLDRLLDKQTRWQAQVPEGMMFWAVLRSMGIPQERIMVDAQSTTTEENILFGKKILGNAPLLKVVAIQEPAMQRRAAAGLQQGLGAGVNVYAYAPFLFEGASAIANSSLDVIRTRRDRAIREIEKIVTEFPESIVIPPEVAEAYNVLKNVPLEGDPAMITASQIAQVPDVKLVIDWLSEQEQLPADYDLLWLMGSKFPRPALEVAKLWQNAPQDKKPMIVVTGGVGRETGTIDLARKELGLSEDAVAEIDRVFDSLSNQEILAKFNIRRGEDMRKHVAGETGKDNVIKDWIRFYTKNLTADILANVVDYDTATKEFKKGSRVITESEARTKDAVYIEDAVIGSLKNKETRYSTVIPEGIVYYSILRSQGVGEGRILVDAQSTNSIENIRSGENIIKDKGFQNVVLVQEPYIQKRGKASFLKEAKGVYKSLTSYAAHKYQDLENPFALTQAKFEQFRVNALSEVDKLRTYPDIGKAVPVEIPEAISAAVLRLDKAQNDVVKQSAPDGQDLGGIDIQNIDITQKRGGAKIQFSDQALRDVLKNGFNGFKPVITDVMLVTSPLVAMGLAGVER